MNEMILPLLRGLAITVQLTLAAVVLAVVIALAAGLARMSPRRALAWPAAVYVEVFRGTSALVQLFWFYFVLPFFGIKLSAFAAGMLVLALNTGAYGAEVVRGAVLAVPRGQLDASAALNLSRLQTLWRIVLPQAFPAMLPPAGNLAIELLKNSALVSLITITELTFAAQLLRAESLRSAEIFSLVLVLYFAVALCITAGMRLLERRAARGLERGGA
ncbi:MAG: ectoine/hydroxyectoine ABC transporter permease subunit EhuC [Betaproteobacteria bacterium]|nr:ectoine/hydroxyectoine ABC transporter permease subunit EhuC [Betaproteobacteria bacterium]MDH3436629.1 ectoine/hydroxyectoine ABC transporter permease subunit EhuC [Betaproteobacteria bacterium]